MWLILELTGNVGTLVKLVGIVEETSLAHVVAGNTVVHLAQSAADGQVVLGRNGLVLDKYIVPVGITIASLVRKPCIRSGFEIRITVLGRLTRHVILDFLDMR